MITNARMNQLQRTDKPILYPQVSYQIMSVLFDTQNKLGNQLQEKYYQAGIAAGFKARNIPFQREVHVRLNDKHGQIGNYFLDFIIDRKIAVEVKAKPAIYNKDIRQLLAYLSVTHLKLGIIANFRTPRLTYRRVVNAQI